MQTSITSLLFCGTRSIRSCQVEKFLTSQVNSRVEESTEKTCKFEYPRLKVYFKDNTSHTIITVAIYDIQVNSIRVRQDIGLITKQTTQF